MPLPVIHHATAFIASTMVPTAMLPTAIVSPLANAAFP